MKKTLSRIYSMMLVVCMILSMLSFSVSAEEVTAEIILETTNAAPADGEVVLMGETLMVSANVTATAYAWYYEGSTTVRGTGATFYPPASYRDGAGEKKVYCEITHAGGKVTTQSVTLEPVVISDPHSYANKDGNNAYKKVPNAENSDSAYTFYVDGKGFVLAKEQNVKGSAYFIVAMDAWQTKSNPRNKDRSDFLCTVKRGLL